MNEGTRILITAVLLLALGPGALAAQEGQSGDPSSVLEGVYTEEQAERGEATYQNVCSYCHSTSEFSGSSFLQSWSGAPIGQFYGLISATMPYDGPGSLSRQQYTDVIAYILSLNDFPTGETELPANPDALDGIRIERPSEESDAGS